MRITGLDHLVLTVADIGATCGFYEGVLGMTRESFAGGRTALKFGSQKFNLHQAGKEFEPKAKKPVPGSADICLLVDDLAEAISTLEEQDVEIIDRGPRTGANGAITSIYCRDPDGNLVELAEYVREQAP